MSRQSADTRSTSIIRAIGLNRVNLVKHVTRNKNVYRFLLGSLKEQDGLEDLGVDMRIILK